MPQFKYPFQPEIPAFYKCFSWVRSSTIFLLQIIWEFATSLQCIPAAPTELQCRKTIWSIKIQSQILRFKYHRSNRWNQSYDPEPKLSSISKPSDRLKSRLRFRSNVLHMYERVRIIVLGKCNNKNRVEIKPTRPRPPAGKMLFFQASNALNTSRSLEQHTYSLSTDWGARATGVQLINSVRTWDGRRRLENGNNKLFVESRPRR